MPKFAGKSSYVVRGNAKKKPEQVKTQVSLSQKVAELSIEECFVNPIIKVSIGTGKVLHERKCAGTWS